MRIAAALLFILSSGTTLLSGCASMQPLPPFLQAVNRDNRAEIFSLLAKSEELKVRSSNEGRELILAILHFEEAYALRLVDSGADVNTTIINSPFHFYDGYTPLILAVWADDPNLVKALVAKGADVNGGTSHFGQNMPVVGLAQNSSMVRLLLDLGVPIDKQVALISVAKKTDTDSARLLISVGADAEQAIHSIEKEIRGWESSEYADNPAIQKGILQSNRAVNFLMRLSQSQAPVAQSTSSLSGQKAAIAPAETWQEESRRGIAEAERDCEGDAKCVKRLSPLLQPENPEHTLRFWMPVTAAAARTFPDDGRFCNASGDARFACGVWVVGALALDAAWLPFHAIGHALQKKDDTTVKPSEASPTH
jgi:hypothetical protein